MLLKKKIPNLEEVLKVVQDYVNGELETRDKAIKEFEKQKQEAAAEIQKIVQKMNEKAKLQGNETKLLESELSDLIFEQEAVAGDLLYATTENEKAALEAKLVDMSVKRNTLEAKIKAFSNNRIGLSNVAERKALAQKVQEYDAITFKGISYSELESRFAELFKTVEDALKPILNRLNFNENYLGSIDTKLNGVGVAFKYSLFDSLVSPETSKLFDMYSERGLYRERAEEKKQIVVMDWLLDKRNIKLEDFAANYIATEKARIEDIRLEEAEQKAREKRERDKHNEEVMSKVARMFNI